MTEAGRVLVVVLLGLLALGVASCGKDQPAPSDVEVPVWAKFAPEQIAEAKRLDLPVAFENEIGMRFVLIPAGTFRMGSAEDEEGRFDEEGSQHDVTLSPFYLATTEVTQAAWEAVMGENPSRVLGDQLPVTDVTWQDCQRFVGRVKDDGPGGPYRLPTEAEWEYACRAGTTTRYWSGAEEGDLARVGWYEANSDRSPRSVGEKPANPWGLHDMHGNVWEWCADRWHDSYKGAPVDGSAWAEGGGSGDRVYRGGSWFNAATFARSAYRSRGEPDHGVPGLRFGLMGLRPARSVTTD